MKKYKTLWPAGYKMTESPGKTWDDTINFFYWILHHFIKEVAVVKMHIVTLMLNYWS